MASIKIDKEFFPIYGLVFAILALNTFGQLYNSIQSIAFLNLLIFFGSAFFKQYKKIILVTIVLAIFLNQINIFLVIFSGFEFNNSDINTIVHVASQKLLNGENPYATDFHGTEMEQYLKLYDNDWQRLGYNYFAIDTFAYFPGIFLLSIPAHILFGQLSIYYLIVILIIGMIFFASYLSKNINFAIFALALLLLNPATNNFTNAQEIIEIASYFFLLGFSVFTLKNKEIEAGIFLGAFFTLRQFSILAFPFIALFLLKNKKIKILITALIVSTSIILPFIVWSPADLFSDTISRIFCNSSNCYPLLVKFPSVFEVLTRFGINAEKSSELFSLISFSAIIGITLLIFSKYAAETKISLSKAMFFSGITIFIAIFFSKIGSPNYYQYATFFMSLALVAHAYETNTGLNKSHSIFFN